MPTDVLESPFRPDSPRRRDPAPSPVRRRSGAVLSALAALALVVLVVFAAGVNYAIAHEYGGGLGLTWVVAGVAALAWVLLVAAAACTPQDDTMLRSVRLPADSFVPGVDGAADGSCRLRFWVRGDAGRDAGAALLAQGWQRAGTEPDTGSVGSRVRWTRDGQVIVSGVELGPDEPGKGSDGVLTRP
jgi:hypothetical protein